MAIDYKHIIVLILQLTTVCPDKCLESIPTLSNVLSCPETESELKRAIQKKQCDKLAKAQSCTKTQDFRYHCIPNSWKNATIEVCAPVIYSQGYCIEFDEGGSQLQELYEEDCTNFTTNKCSTRFSSSDLLHYKQCNSIIKRRTLERPNGQRGNKHEMTLLALTISFGTLFIISFVIGAACIRRLCVKIRVKHPQPFQDPPNVDISLPSAQLENSTSRAQESTDEEQKLVQAQERSDTEPRNCFVTESPNENVSQNQRPVNQLMIESEVEDEEY